MDPLCIFLWGDVSMCVRKTQFMRIKDINYPKRDFLIHLAVRITKGRFDIFILFITQYCSSSSLIFMTVYFHIHSELFFKNDCIKNCIKGNKSESMIVIFLLLIVSFFCAFTDENSNRPQLV